MISISNIKSAGRATHYYEKDDYYAKDDPEHKNGSLWHGKGANLLGLSGEVEKEGFQAILSGKLKNNIELGRKEDGELIHAPGIDLTFSAPKSVSIMAEVYGDKRIYEAQKEAVLRTLNYIEKNLVQTRKMENGVLVNEQVDNITVGIFRHHTSRNLDPQLHTHCVIANAIQRSDGQWRSAFFGKIFDNKLFLGQVYRSELAYQLDKMGYELKIKENGLFELKDIPESLIKAFSTRSKDIADAAEGYEHVDARLKASLTIQTRENKQEVSHEILQERWQQTIGAHTTQINNTHEAKSEGIRNYLENKWEAFRNKFDISRIFKIGHVEQSNETTKSIEEKAIEYAIAHLSERQSVWEERELLGVAMSYTIGKTNLANLTVALQNAKAADFILSGANKDFERPLTTKATLEKELNTIVMMKAGLGASSSICSARRVDGCLLNTNLNQGQQDAAKLILTSKDRVVGIQGYAGVGKTYMLQHVREVAQESGYRIIGLAPSSAAAITLEKEAGIASQTIHKFLFKYNGLIHDRGTEEGRVTMCKDMKDTVVIVDESSLASTGQMNALLKVSQALDFKAVLVGDTKQLNAVEAGKPFYQLQKAGMHTAIMGEIKRQKDQMLKSAVYDAINGEIKQAFSKLKNSIIEPSIKFDNIADTRNCLANLAADKWLSLSNEERRNTLLTAPSHIIRESINKEIRERLKSEGGLQGKTHNLSVLASKDLTMIQKAYAPNYEVGDVVLFNRPYKSLNIKQGEYVSVSEVKDRVVVLKKENGHLTSFEPGKLAGNRKGAIDVFKSKNLEVQAGELIRWTRNSSDNAEIVNSKIATITSITDKAITIKSASGQVNLSLDNSYLKHIDHGYALTVHAAQGATYDSVIGVLESSHPNLTTQKGFYVTISRAKHSATLITDDKTKLQETLIQKTGEIVSATELQSIKNKNITKNVVQLTSKVIKQYAQITTKDIYHDLYSKIPQVLPEFGFKPQGSYYVSTTPQKVDGSSGKPGKVFIYANNPGMLVDYTRGNQSIWDYVKTTYLPNGTKSEVMSYLCDMAGLSSREYTPTRVLQPSLYTPTSEAKVEPLVDKRILETIHDFARSSLFQGPNRVLEYLKNPRCYDSVSIKDMELGYIHSKKAMAQHLRSLGYSEEAIKNTLKAFHYIGKTHNLLIPYRDSKGDIIGFASRNIDYKETDEIGKYLYTKGLSRSSSLLGLHNIKGAKEVVLVEGMLDASHAQAKGMNNVLSLGGTGFNDKQLRLLHMHGVKSVVLCLDNDKAGIEAAGRIRNIASNADLDIKLKQATLPIGIKDPDQMIKERGIEAFKMVVAEAKVITLNRQAAQQSMVPLNCLNSPNNAKDVEFEK
ncbi:MAG: TrwC protein [Candidatus Midichloriaceae bacterium]|jgi:conjugative relaxase-like TrwC/TraI family protein|nr:TrwC protein [Candidatus Midichloriaceae bacterium]